MSALIDSLKLIGAQKDAVVARGVDVLVTAGAGSGKTRTLVARYMSLLEEGLQPRQIVAVTFTEKAAREMRNRIRAAINEWRTGGCPLAERARWDEVEADIDAARIGTIHSLCASLMRAHPAEARIDPLVSVLEDNLATTLRNRAIEDAISWAIGRPDLKPLFDSFGIDELRSVLATLLASRLEAPQALDSEAPKRWRRVLLQAMMGFVASDDVSAAIRLMRELKENGRLEADAGDKLAEQTEGLLVKWEELEQALETGDFVAAACALHTARRDHSALNVGKKTSQVKAALREMREEYDAKIAPWLGDNRGSPPDAEVERRAAEATGLVRKLFEAADKAYQTAKDLRQAVDFDDLEIGAVRLLEIPSVRARWQSEVAALLVDEFQDTNGRQRKIVESLAGITDGANGKLFVVGDAKQSIYRFRGADVSVFRSISDDISARGGRAISLDITFRAHDPLVRAMNELLGPILGETDDAERPFAVPFAPLRAARSEPRCQIQEPFVEIFYGLGDDSEAARSMAAKMLACRLLELREFEGVHWQEIALLFRATAGFPAYEEALEEAGIPFVTVAGKGFYDRPEVRDILNILRALADPGDDLAMAGLLRSPAFGLSDAALYQLRWPSDDARAPRGFYIALREDISQLSETDTRQARRARDIIDDLSGLADRITVAELIKAMLDKTLYRAILGASSSGARLQRNVDKLLSDASASGLVRVAEYLEYVENLREGGAREGEAPAEAGGAVRLMTVHRAKGLEFPVVVIADASRGRPFNYGPGILSSEFGFVPNPKRFERKPLVYNLVRHLDAEQADCEDRRLLYVAATRAKEKLLICGHQSSRQSGSWLTRIAESARLGLELLCDMPGQRKEITLPSSGQKVVAIANFEVPLPAEISSVEAEANADRISASPPLYEPIPLKSDAELAEESEVAESPIPRITGRRHLDGTIAGNLVHEAIRYWRFPGDPVLERFLTTKALSSGLAEKSDIDEHVQHASALLARFKRDPRWPELDAARRWHELPYCIKRGELPSVGVIDLLYQTTDGGRDKWRIIDIKSEHISNEDELRAKLSKYGPQLRKYGHAVTTLLGGPVEMLICFLDFAGKIRWEEVS